MRYTAVCFVFVVVVVVYVFCFCCFLVCLYSYYFEARFSNDGVVMGGNKVEWAIN